MIFNLCVMFAVYTEIHLKDCVHAEKRGETSSPTEMEKHNLLIKTWPKRTTGQHGNEKGAKKVC